MPYEIHSVSNLFATVSKDISTTHETQVLARDHKKMPFADSLKEHDPTR